MGIRGRKRAAPVNIDDVDGNTPISSEYEQLREKRIKENLERMEKLGIFDISLKLKSVKKATVRKIPQRLSPLQPSGPSRRSSRLQNGTPVSYSEVDLSKIDKSLDGGHHLLREEGSKPEIYTEEHEKLLGSTDLSWTLFVDGYGNDGKRIYDPVKGKTCHQCRQKTLGQRTHCSKCQLVQGQFCGDCLYMRYGEHVLEAKKNPDWICPACRGICNCSLCRQAKGWAPTGALYRKIAKLGYKSVAHYLIQTHRASVSPENNSAPVSAKRSLPFSDMEGTMKDEELCIHNSDSQGLVMTTQTEMKTVECDPNEPNVAPESSTEPLVMTTQTEVKTGECDKSNIAPESSTEPLPKSIVEPLLLKHESGNSDMEGTMKDEELCNHNSDSQGLVMTTQTEVKTVECDPNDPNLAPESSTEPSVMTTQTEVKTVECDPNEPNLAPESSTEPLLKSIVEPLLLLKHESDNSDTNLVLSCDNVGNSSADNKAGNESEPVLTELNDGYKGELQLAYEFDIGEMQLKEVKEDGTCVSDDKNCDGLVAPEASSKTKKKPGRVAAQVVDSIAGRLRQRRGRSYVEA